LFLQGVLHDGPVVAIKKIPCSYKLSKHICDILSHVSKLEQKNIVRLLGYGYRVTERATELQDEKDYMFLVEEYMPNGSLDRIIYGMFPLTYYIDYISPIYDYTS
jgi:L1 cell adhesion molecule like protein